MLNHGSVARQVFVLQAVVVLLLVLASVVALLVQVREDENESAHTRALAVAETFANAPGTAAALRAPDPTAVLQPRAEEARRRSGVDFVVAMSTSGIRYTHPDRNRIGRHFVGDISAARHGHVDRQRIVGTIGALEQVVVPVRDGSGRIVGLVSAGIKIETVSSLVARQLPLVLAAAMIALAMATVGTALVSRRLRRQTHGLGAREMTRMYEHHDAVLHAVHEGVLIVSAAGRLLLANDEAVRLLDLPPDAQGRHVTDLGLDPSTTELLVSGRVATDEVHVAADRLLAVNNRPTDVHGGPPGTVATLRDSTELQAVSSRADEALGRLKMLYDAGGGIGTTLDVRTTAEELVQIAVPGFADFATVDIAEDVLRGNEPVETGMNVDMRRMALAGVREDFPLYQVDEKIAFRGSTPMAQALVTGQVVLERDVSAAPRWHSQDPDLARTGVEYGMHSQIAAPLRARGVLLGMVIFWRADNPEPFGEDDVSLAAELAARGAVCIDNARRYTRERQMAVTLQRSLLPHALPEQSGVDVAYRYLPAQAGVGGDWFDVIPLPGARVALVVGDVVGHGLHAAATMGRLRTAVHNFSALDLPPDEILGHLDELVGRIDQERTEAGDELSITGATCLYAIYDPVTRRCNMARAGHPAPAVVGPDGSVEFPELPAGLPLGIGGLPFESTELQLPEDSRLVLYTDGLIERRDQDIDAGIAQLGEALAHPGRTPEETCEAVLSALLPARPGDDIALLVARTRMLGRGNVAEWDVRPDPSAVREIRAQVQQQLADWGLDEVAFTTELILSELITNSIRYATGPIRVRLLRDRALICEVSDTSTIAPHLRYAAGTDEGGRGLFLVAQFADRWGTRYTGDGKVIWTEQQLPGSGGA